MALIWNERSETAHGSLAMASRLQIVPDVVNNQRLCAMQPDGRVDEAARRMRFFNIGAIVIVNDRGRLIGIVTERDITRRVVADCRDPRTVTLADIMSRDPDTVGPEDTAQYALDLMRTRGYRHLPVVAGDRLVGIVSVRDLYEVTKLDLEQGIDDDGHRRFDDAG